MCLDLLHDLSPKSPRRCPRCHRHMPLESLLSQRFNLDQCGSIWCKMQDVAETEGRRGMPLAHQDLVKRIKRMAAREPSKVPHASAMLQPCSTTPIHSPADKNEHSTLQPKHPEHNAQQGHLQTHIIFISCHANWPWNRQINFALLRFYMNCQRNFTYLVPKITGVQCMLRPSLNSWPKCEWSFEKCPCAETPSLVEAFWVCTCHRREWQLWEASERNDGKAAGPTAKCRKMTQTHT